MGASGNVFEQTAQGLGAAGEGAMAGMFYQPMMVNPNFQAPMIGTQFGYAPQMVQPGDYGQYAINYRPGTAMSAGYSSVRAPRGYSPMMVEGQGYQASQLAGTDLSPYFNPYESQVISNVTRDLGEAQQQQQNIAAAKASAAGAFGGSRQALMEAQTVADYARNVGDVSSRLRQQGFQTAQQAALQDIAAANQAAQFGAAQSQQANLANQAAQAAADQFGRSQQMQAALANQALRGQLGQFDVAQMLRAQMANQQLGVTGQQAALQAALANQAAGGQASRFGQQMGLQATTANQRAALQSQQMALQAMLANQQAGLAGAGQRLAAGGQLANIANLGFGQGQTVQAGLAQAGAQQQALQQQLINAARGQFQQFTQQPYQSLQMMQGLLGPLMGFGGQNQSYTPGLFDYLGLGAGVAGSALGNPYLMSLMFSDRALKTNIEPAGKTPSGINLYTWDWNDEAKRIGAGSQPTYGVIAQELQETHPEAVIKGDDGYLRVDYSKVH